jgi:hypothetical protein
VQIAMDGGMGPLRAARDHRAYATFVSMDTLFRAVSKSLQGSFDKFNSGKKSGTEKK